MQCLSIFLQLVFLFVYIRVTLNGAEERFDPGKVSVIKILPYHFNPDGAPDAAGPTAASETSHKFNPAEHYGRPYTTTKGAPNEHNLGKTFAYITPGEIVDSGADTVKYMQHVAAYHRTFNACDADPKSNKNVLLVRICITATLQPDRRSGSTCGSTASGGGGAAEGDGSNTYEYFFGIFVSGGQKYRCGEVRDLVPPSKDLPLPLRSALECKSFRDLWGNESVRAQLRVYSLIKDRVPDAILLEDDVEELISEGIYKTPLLRLQLGGELKKFAPFSNVDVELEKTIGTRLFSFPASHPLNAIFNAPNPATAAANGERALEVSMQREVTGVNREKLTQQLFGKPSYKDCGPLKACLAKKSDLELCFNQAEQAWVSLLEGSFEQNINDLPHCYTTRPLLAGQQYRASRVTIDWYSFLDICRYCRGTFSHMIGSGKMHEMLSDFFGKLKVAVDFRGSDMHMLAFSYEKTDIT